MLANDRTLVAYPALHILTQRESSGLFREDTYLQHLIGLPRPFLTVLQFASPLTNVVAELTIEASGSGGVVSGRYREPGEHANGYSRKL